MRNRLQMKTRFTVLAFVCLLVSSCSHTVTVEAPLLNPVVEKSAIKVAVVYDDALRNFQCTASKGYIADEWLIAPGSASVATFTAVFPYMFEDVIFLPAGAETAAGKDRYVIRVSLESYTRCDVYWPIIGQSVDITYAADVARGSEKILESWTGYGQGTAQEIQDRHGNTMNTEAYLSWITTFAIREAVADFLWKFEEDERVDAWKSAAISEAHDN